MSKPFWKQKTFWAFAVSVALAAPALVEQIAPFLTDDQRLKAAGLAAMAAALGNIFARMGATEAAKEAVAEHEKATGLPGLTQPPAEVNPT